MSTRFKVKYLQDGRAMLNVGCGTRMDWSWNNLDFSLYVLLSHYPFITSILRKIGLLSEGRYQHSIKVDPDSIYWDVTKGLPFDNETFDVVYHSHLLEHLDRDLVPKFLNGCHRVLKPTGIMRVAVPDLEKTINQYNETLILIKNGGDESAIDQHLQSIHELFNQIVYREPSSIKIQRPWVRFIERIIRGDAIRIGESHRWMYDSYSLKRLLSEIGFTDIEITSASESRISGWNSFRLDTDENGSICKPESLFMEAVVAGNARNNIYI